MRHCNYLLLIYFFFCCTSVNRFQVCTFLLKPSPCCILFLISFVYLDDRVYIEERRNRSKFSPSSCTVLLLFNTDLLVFFFLCLQVSSLHFDFILFLFFSFIQEKFSFQSRFRSVLMPFCYLWSRKHVFVQSDLPSSSSCVLSLSISLFLFIWP